MIFRSSLIVTGMTLLGTFLGFFVQIEIAKQFGTDIQVDGYLFATSIPTFFAGMFSSFLSYVITPRIAQGNELERNRLLVSLIFGVGAIAVILVLLIPLFQILQMSYLPKSSPIFHLIELGQLLKLGWWIAATQVLLACLSAVLTGLKRPLIATTLNLGPYLGMLGLLEFSSDGSIIVVAKGMLLGTTLSLLLAFTFLVSRIAANWRSVAWSEIHILISRSPLTIIAMVCFSAYSVIDSYWGPRAGEGVLSILGYSQRIIIGLGNFAIIGPSVVLVPLFAELIAKKDKNNFFSLFIKTFISVGTIALSLAALIFFFAEELISFLFMRGAFEYNAVSEISAAMRYFLPGMIFMLLSVMGLRVIYCFNSSEKTLAILGLGWVVVYFAISATLFESGAPGLAMAYSLSWILYFFVLIIIIKKKFSDYFR